MKNYYAALLLLVVASGCFKKDFGPAPSPSEQTMDQMTVSPSFEFNTDAKVTYNITALDNADQPVKGIRINLYKPLLQPTSQDRLTLRQIMMAMA